MWAEKEVVCVWQGHGYGIAWVHSDRRNELLDRTMFSMWFGPSDSSSLCLECALGFWYYSFEAAYYTTRNRTRQSQQRSEVLGVLEDKAMTFLGLMRIGLTPNTNSLSPSSPYNAMRDLGCDMHSFSLAIFLTAGLVEIEVCSLLSHSAILRKRIHHSSLFQKKYESKYQTKKIDLPQKTKDKSPPYNIPTNIRQRML